jgi:hypothetical protein
LRGEEEAKEIETADAYERRIAKENNTQFQELRDQAQGLPAAVKGSRAIRGPNETPSISVDLTTESGCDISAVQRIIGGAAPPPITQMSESTTLSRSTARETLIQTCNTLRENLRFSFGVYFYACSSVVVVLSYLSGSVGGTLNEAAFCLMAAPCHDPSA